MCYWLITESSKLISKLSVKQVTFDDYLCQDIKKQIDEFSHNCKLEDALDDTNFQEDWGAEFEGMYLFDIDDDDDDEVYPNTGVICEDDTTPNTGMQYALSIVQVQHMS